MMPPPTCCGRAKDDDDGFTDRQRGGELPRHTEAGGNRDDEEDAWIVARDNESVDSFLTNCPPSFMEKVGSAQHDGMTTLSHNITRRSWARKRGGTGARRSLSSPQRGGG